MFTDLEDNVTDVYLPWTQSYENAWIVFFANVFVCVVKWTVQPCDFCDVEMKREKYKKFLLGFR